MLNIDEKKHLIEKNMRFETVPEVPFLIEIGQLHAAYYKYISNDQAEVDWNVEYHNMRNGIYDYGIPNIKPNMGIGIVAAAFGCEAMVNSEADPWIKPLIKEENIEDVYNLKIPDVIENPIFKRAWERVEFIQKVSTLPLRVVNVPSPLITASLIWEYASFLEALVIYPKEVHVLMDKITKATIAYIKEQFKRIKNLHSVSHELWYVPKDAGIRISDDTAVLLSPDMYREFGVKYNSEISREFGGVIVHSCGDVKNVVEPMMEIEGLSGLDFTITQNPNWQPIKAAASGKVPLYLRHLYWDYVEGSNIDLAEYSKQLVEFFGREGLFIHTSAKTADEARILGERLHKIL